MSKSKVGRKSPIKDKKKPMVSPLKSNKAFTFGTLKKIRIGSYGSIPVYACGQGTTTGTCCSCGGFGGGPLAAENSESWPVVLDAAHFNLAQKALYSICLRISERISARPRDYSLSTGIAGCLLFLRHLKVAVISIDCSEEIALAEHFLTRQNYPASTSFFNGYRGVRWALQHSSDQRNRPQHECRFSLESFQFADHYMHRLIKSGKWDGSYDLLNGLVGIGTSALASVKNDALSHETARSVVIALSRLSQPLNKNRTWTTPRRHSPGGIDLLTKRGNIYNLGIAHGIPGIISFLSCCILKRVEVSLCEEMLEESVPWILGIIPTQQSGYPHWMDSRGNMFGQGIAWCYGDAGVGAALWLAGLALKKPRWQKISCDIVLRSISNKDAVKTEPGLCHGLSGLGLIYQRFYHRTQDPVLLRASQRCFESLLTKSGVRTGDFRSKGRSRQPVKDRTAPLSPLRWRSDTSFLTGSAGVGLALISACYPVTPSWDASLLVSCP